MIKAGFPAVGVPFVNPDTGVIDQAWYLLLQTLWQRTGSAPGVDVVSVVNNVTTITNELSLALLDDAPAIPPAISVALAALQSAVSDLAVLLAMADPRPVLSDPWMAVLTMPDSNRPTVDPWMAALITNPG